MGASRKWHAKEVLSDLSAKSAMDALEAQDDLLAAVDPTYALIRLSDEIEELTKIPSEVMGRIEGRSKEREKTKNWIEQFEKDFSLPLPYQELSPEEKAREEELTDKLIDEMSTWR